MSKVSMILNMISVQRKFLVRAAQMSVRNISVSSALRKNHYETLGVSRDATQTEIKNAYFELSKLYHPDRIAATDENLAKFREVSAAYEVLGNEHSRRLYDRGMLGEIRKAEEEEPSDPIVKFYKQRRHTTAEQAKDDLDAWAQTYFAEAKKSRLKKHHLYTHAAKSPLSDDPMWLMPSFLILVVVGVLFSTNFKNNKLGKLFEEFSF